MKLQQIQYVIEINRANSISGAAKNLFTSQSHISNELKALEQELGFVIFERTAQGVRLTDQGQAMLNIAMSIHELTDQMRSIKKGKEISDRVSIATENMSFCLEAFSKLCIKHGANNLKLLGGCPSEVCSMVAQSDCEIGILTANSTFSDAFMQKLKSQNLYAHRLGKLGLYIRLSRQHPIFQNFQQTKVIDYASLMNYPYINTEDSDNSLRYILNDIFGWFVSDSTNQIILTDREYKRRIVCSTLAWSIGVCYSERDESDFEGARILIPGIAAEVIYVTKKKRMLSELAQDYLTLLRKELDAINKFTANDLREQSLL
ncbi:LysR family transcriptional regulator [Pseudoflavonifractor sp. 60]|uniref:LysR family transcriptional regulator n=1 Tax=Pseudoflavonifractor sp. 60 TaxID=2304576 RepID=UPI001368FEB8|nr:LysR family transcriptional regulator [Pseudoflavonifractor sp. 60]NBI67910.1 LysR family transcriptional regulator [Pseudoflavonifractor sp. 60]